jgi:hypothetical protein
MNSRTAKRLLIALLLCLQLGAGLPAPGVLAALHGAAPTTAAPHCAHAMAGQASQSASQAQNQAAGQASHRANHAGCCVEAGCNCACLVADFAPQPTLFASALLQSIPLPLSPGATPARIDSPLRPPI